MKLVARSALRVVIYTVALSVVLLLQAEHFDHTEVSSINTMFVVAFFIESGFYLWENRRA